MASIFLKVRIFAASPEDVSRDREALRVVTDELNRGVAAERRLTLELVTWKDVHPDIGRPEQVILDQIGTFDIFIGLMGRRFGTGTGKYEGGTEEEFYAAYGRFRATGSPRIMFYFNQEIGPPPRHEEELEQLLKVVRFRKAIAQHGLYREYSDHQEFLNYVRQDLTSVLVTWPLSHTGKLGAEPTSVRTQVWPVWRDARVPGRAPGESVETALCRAAKHSVKFMTVAGKSISNTRVQNILKSKPRDFDMKLLLFDWNSPQFVAKMRDEGRRTAADVENNRESATDVAERFLRLARLCPIHFEIKLYSQYPVWRLLIADIDRAYTGYYLPEKRGYEGPMVLFESSDETGLFYPVNRYFDFLWEESGCPLQLGDSRFELRPMEIGPLLGS